MKIVLFDCFNGISGDMTVGAFLDAGLKLNLLKKRLSALGIGGYKISAAKILRGGIAGTKFNVEQMHGKHSKGVSYADIKKLITKSKLDVEVKTVAISIFEKLAVAESKIHGVDNSICP